MIKVKLNHNFDTTYERDLRLYKFQIIWMISDMSYQCIQRSFEHFLSGDPSNGLKPKPDNVYI